MGLAPKGRSKLEGGILDTLTKSNLKWAYEEDKIPYVVPEKKHYYNPDFRILCPTSGRRPYVELKGRFTSEDRQKMLLVMQQNPTLDLVMVFPRPGNKIRKGSKMDYRMWCEKHNLLWADLNSFLECIAKADFTKLGLPLHHD